MRTKVEERSLISPAVQTAILAERLVIPVIADGERAYWDNRNMGVSLRADSQRPSLPVDNETKFKRQLKKEDEIERGTISAAELT